MAEHCTNINFGHEFAQIGKFSPPIEYYQTENIIGFLRLSQSRSGTAESLNVLLSIFSVT